MPFAITHTDFKKESELGVEPLWGIDFDSHKKDGSMATYVEKWYALELYLGMKAIHIYWYKEKLE